GNMVNMDIVFFLFFAQIIFAKKFVAKKKISECPGGCKSRLRRRGRFRYAFFTTRNAKLRSPLVFFGIFLSDIHGHIQCTIVYYSVGGLYNVIFVFFWETWSTWTSFFFSSWHRFFFYTVLIFF
ncbi:MAG: hypothetical protein ACK55Z_26450, partial [bacterium]